MDVDVNTDVKVGATVGSTEIDARGSEVVGTKITSGKQQIVIRYHLTSRSFVHPGIPLWHSSLRGPEGHEGFDSQTPVTLVGL